MSDNIHLDALPRLAEGIRKATEVVAKTMGPRGSNVTIESKLYPYSLTTNDGATIIKEIVLADPIEKIGLAHLQQAADRSNNNSGDGSTTTAVLLNAILQEGIKAAANGLELKQSLDACLPVIEDSIKQQTQQITIDDVPAVARVAGESEDLAAKLGEIYKEIGKDGIIHLDNSGTYDTSYELIDGVRFVDTGVLSPYMFYDEQAEKDGKKATKAVYHKPAILVTKNKIGHIRDIDPILAALVALQDPEAKHSFPWSPKNLVIFTDDMDSGVARILIELQKNPQRSINILVIKAPALWKGYVFEDFAKITGATIIEDSSGTSLGNKFRLDWLGTCDTLICDKEELTVIGIKDIEEHKSALEREGSNDSKLRLSWLNTKTAILKLGAKSETELSWLRAKAEDAIFSCRTALAHGVVVGGGLALQTAAESMPDTVGGNILKVALTKPTEQIVQNAGGTDGLFGEEVVDSADIVLGAIRNALGIASILLTTSSVVTLPPPSEEELRNKATMRPMGF